MSYSATGDNGQAACPPCPAVPDAYREKTDAMLYSHVGAIATILMGSVLAIAWGIWRKRP